MVLKYHHKGRAGLMLRRKAVSAVETPRKKEISMNLQLLGQSKVVSQPSGIHHYSPSSDLVGGGCQLITLLQRPLSLLVFGIISENKQGSDQVAADGEEHIYDDKAAFDPVERIENEGSIRIEESA